MTSQKKRVIYDSDSDENSSEIESIENDTIESSEQESEESDVEINETFNDEEEQTQNVKKSVTKRDTGNDDFLTADSDIDELNKSESIDEISPIKKLESSDEENETSLNETEDLSSKHSESENSKSNFLDEEARTSNHESQDEDNSFRISNENDSEDEEEIASKVRKNTRRITDSDDEDDNKNEQRRKTFYMENPDGDTSFIVEDNVYSKSTRRSMFGGIPEDPEVKSEPISENELSDGEDSDVIICESESEQENLETSGMIVKSLSSTTRSPFKEIDRNSVVKKEPLASPEKSKNLQRVSKSYYDSQVAEIEAMKGRIEALRKMELKGSLPDNGQKLRIAAVKIQNDINEKERLIKTLIVDEDKSIKNQLMDSFKSESERSSIKEESKGDEDFLAAEDVQPKYTGKIGMKNFEQQKALTVEKLQDIQNSLDQRPADDALETPPKDLKIELMKHQLHALAFMMWRETQKPRGGILADDMGLGKTLTVISLILKQLQKAEEMDEESDYDSDANDKEKEDQWISQGHKSLRDGGTLVVCPASLINQWEYEIKNKLKRNALNVNVFHGPKREYRAKVLARYDVVITTYQIILSESKNEGCLSGIKWDRIVLDEGHVIRNYRSKQSEAVCNLIGKKRWVLTGTPIQNKEFDIYAAIKFLRCSPFDDIRYWRTWIETKKGSSPRLQTLLKSILLRRTKQQLMESGEVQSLPEKQYEEFQVALNREERSVYNRILAFSQAVFAQFLSQHQEKYNTYTYDRNQLGKLHQKFAKINNVEREVKAHEILTLLLRLRQVCCHPGLVKQAIASHEMDVDIDQGEKEQENTSVNDSDIDILKKLQNMRIDENNEEVSNTAGAITTDNEVFNMDIPSSKLDKLMEIIREKFEDTDDKAIIVSQWVSYLNIIKSLLEIEGIGYCELNGTIPVKYRNDIVVNFNKPTSNERVMLLSITAGGVGLNLVGANLLFILDPHWNPQIEQQAQDRIYRFGQTKNVKIYKFICEDTIEEKILKKQQEKMNIAESALTGAKRNASKLTIEDLKDLFGMK
ncbi:hypothetical protein ACKWTF_008009 [Chironomus riparius]